MKKLWISGVLQIRPRTQAYAQELVEHSKCSRTNIYRCCWHCKEGTWCIDVLVQDLWLEWKFNPIMPSIASSNPMLADGDPSLPCA